MANKFVYKGYDVGETIQVAIMPTAGASNAGIIIQYIGATNSSYTNGYFYKCILNNGTYEWNNINVQEDGGTPHWTGTQAEYNAAASGIEDGTIVNITDDYQEGVEVVDIVEEDNMNAVTSNAIYDAINAVTNGTINDTNEYGNTTIEWFKNGRIIIYKIRVSNATTGNSSLWDVSLPQNVRPPYDENGMKTVLGWDGKTAGEAYVYQNSTSIRIAVNGDYDSASGQLIAFV